MGNLFKKAPWLWVLILLFTHLPLHAQTNNVKISGKLINGKSLEGSYAYLMVFDTGTSKYKFHKSAIKGNAFKINLIQTYNDTLVYTRLFLSPKPEMTYNDYVENIRSYHPYSFYLDTASIKVTLNQATKRAMVVGGEFNRQKRKYDIVDSIYHVKVQRRGQEKNKSTVEFFNEVNSYKTLAYLDVVKQYPNSLLSMQNMTVLGGLTIPMAFEHRDKILETLKSLSPELQETEKVKAIYAAYAARIKRMENKRGILFPNLALVDKSLKPYSFNQIFGTHEYILLDFWATWCHPCIKQHPAIQKLSQGLNGSNIKVVGISVDSELDKWGKYMVKHSNNTYPQYRLDPSDKKLLDEIGIAHLPTYTLIEKCSGKIVEHDIKFTDLEQTLEKYRK